MSTEAQQVMPTPESATPRTPDHAPTLAKAMVVTVPVAIVDAAIAGAIGGAVAGTGFSVAAAAAVGIPAALLAFMAYSMCAVAGTDDELAGRC